jgi:ribosomal protein S3
VGQKVHPYGFRLGYNKDWHSHWFAKKQFGEFLLEDLKLKRDLKHRFAGAGVSHVDIERAANRLKIIIYTSRPGIIIGRKGAEIDKLKSDLSMKTGREVLVSIQEIHKPELNAQLQAEKIAAQLEKRIAFPLAASGICKGSCRCTRCARISITVWRKRRRRLDRSASRFGFIAGRSWIRRLRWLVVLDRIRSMRRALVNVSVARVRGVNAKVDLTGVDRAATISKGDCQFPIANCRLKRAVVFKSAIGNRQSEMSETLC